MLILLRSALFNILMALSVPLWAIAFFCTLPFPYGWRFAVAINWGRSMLWLLHLICRLDHKVEWQGKLPEAPCVVFWKHESTWETLAQHALFDVRQAWVLKKEILSIPVFGWAMRFLYPIAIDRSAGRRSVDQVVEQGLEKLRSGTWIMIFPEGHRMPAGQTRRYGISGAALAKKAGVPVIPISHNAGDFWGRAQFGKQPGTIQVVVGEAIQTDELSPREINEAAQRFIEKQLRRISPDRDYQHATAEEAVAAHRRNGSG